MDNTHGEDPYYQEQMSKAYSRHDKLNGKDFYEKSGKKDYKSWETDEKGEHKTWQKRGEPPKKLDLESVTKFILGIDNERGTTDGTTNDKEQ